MIFWYTLLTKVLIYGRLQCPGGGGGGGGGKGVLTFFYT